MTKRAAKRPAKRSRKTAKRTRPTGKTAMAKRSGKRQKPTRRPAARKTKPPKPARKSARKKPVPRARAAVAPAKTPRIERVRRTLADEADATIQMPPSSLDLERRGSSVRSGREAMRHTRKDRGGMNSVTAGDVDVDAEDAYFTGEEAPGGDNPTPDSDVVDDIGKALGVPYGDDEELKSVEKVEKRDKHRWELDPASAEDFKERK
jgi:hypothetical protein